MVIYLGCTFHALWFPFFLSKILWSFLNYFEYSLQQRDRLLTINLAFLYSYVNSLLDYLTSYCQRLKPLLDLDEAFDELRKTFDTQWESAAVPGWGKEAGSAMAHTGAHLDLSAFSSPEVCILHIYFLITL